nr:twin-arginine translocase subunit TatC [uncultured Holophaga sp.]
MSDPKPSPDHMNLWEHLQELRVRLVHAVAAVGVAFALTYSFPFGLQDHVRFLKGVQPFRFTLWHWAQAPFLQAMARQTGQPINALQPWAFTDLAEPFFSLMRLSFWAAVFLSAPYIFYQLWLFIRPALHARERRFALPFIIATSLMFVLGAIFAYFQAFNFLGDILFQEAQAAGLRANLHAKAYLDLFLYTLLTLGLMFELPVLAWFLARFRIISARTMLHYWRHASVGIIVASAFLTPGDVVVTTIFFSAVLFALYFVSMGVAWMAEPAAEPECRGGDA